MRDVGLAIADALPPSEVLELLRQRRAASQADIASARTVPQHDGSIQFVVEHRIAHLEAELRWLDTVMGRFATADHNAAHLNAELY